MDDTSTPTRQTESASRYLVVTLYAFAVFGWELIVTMVLDPLLAAAGPSMAAMLHWLITAAGWIAGSLLLLRAIRDPRRGLGGAFGHPLRGGIAWRAVVVAAAVILAVTVRVAALHEWKLPSEYERLSAVHGDATVLAFAVLLAYYLSETLVIVILLALAQRGGERQWGARAVPWGGFALALT